MADKRIVAAAARINGQDKYTADAALKRQAEAQLAARRGKK